MLCEAVCVDFGASKTANSFSPHRLGHCVIARRRFWWLRFYFPRVQSSASLVRRLGCSSADVLLFGSYLRPKKKWTKTIGRRPASRARIYDWFANSPESLEIISHNYIYYCFLIALQNEHTQNSAFLDNCQYSNINTCIHDTFKNDIDIFASVLKCRWIVSAFSRNWYFDYCDYYFFFVAAISSVSFNFIHLVTIAKNIAFS